MIGKMIKKGILIRLAPYFLFSILAACANGGTNNLLPEIENIKEIEFVKRVGNDLDLIAKIIDPAEIEHIVEDIKIGKEVPVSKHIFLKEVVFIMTDGNRLAMPYEQNGSKAAVRIYSRQYLIDRKTIRNFNSYYEQ